MQEEAAGVWHLYAFIYITVKLCREHALSWAEDTLQLAFLMVRLAQTGVLFSSVPCT